MTEDQRYIKRAMELAERGRGTTSPNPMVGAVVVKDGRIIGEGFHQKAGSDHAEVIAMRAAGAAASGATLYLNLEPCTVQAKTPPCTEAIKKSGIKRVVIAAIDPSPKVAGNGIKQLEKAGIEVRQGILDPEAKKLNEVFLTYITKKRPFILMKTAMSFDGKIATFTGESRWISCEECRKLAHKLRSEFDAVIVGIDTVFRDDPLLTPRLAFSSRNSLRIVVDSLGRLSMDSRLVKTAKDYPTMIATTQDAPKKKIDQLAEMGVLSLVLPTKDQKVSLPHLVEELGKKEITSMIIEGGSTINGAFISEGLVDKLLFFISPMIIGGADAPGPIGGEGFGSLKSSMKLSFGETGFAGNNIVVEAYPAPAQPSAFSLKNEEDGHNVHRHS